MYINCPKCATKLPTNLRYCTQCGTKLEHTPVYQSPDPKSFEPTIICPHCSAPVPITSKFCRKCGSSMEVKSHDNYEEMTEQLNYLEKLAELKDKGIISQEEFEGKKKEILKN
jgi:predicted amidophosphoribosyltransferase